MIHCGEAAYLVPVAGLEPARPLRQQILSLPRLPISTHRRVRSYYNIRV